MFPSPLQLLFSFLGLPGQLAASGRGGRENVRQNKWVQGGGQSLVRGRLFPRNERLVIGRCEWAHEPNFWSRPGSPGAHTVPLHSQRVEAPAGLRGLQLVAVPLLPPWGGEGGFSGGFAPPSTSTDIVTPPRRNSLIPEVSPHLLARAWPSALEVMTLRN